MDTSWPAVPVKLNRSANDCGRSIARQSVVASAPPSVAPSVMGVGGQLAALTKSRSLRDVLKTADDGVKASPLLLGVTLYVPPAVNPLCAQRPSEDVWTAPGAAPPPLRAKVTVTPASGTP